MSMPTLDDVRAELPAFADKPDATMERYLARAQRQINAYQWGARAYDGAVALVGHYLAMDAIRDDGARLQSRAVGDVSASYDTPSGGDVLDLTKYGQEFKRLRSLVFIDRP